MNMKLHETSSLAGRCVGQYQASLARRGAVKSGEKIVNAGEIEEEEKRVAATPCLRNGGTCISTLKAAEVYIFCIPEPGRSVSDVSWYW